MITEYQRQIKVLEYENKDLKKLVGLLKECIENKNFEKIVEENERLRYLIKIIFLKSRGNSMLKNIKQSIRNLLCKIGIHSLKLDSIHIKHYALYKCINPNCNYSRTILLRKG